MSSNGGTSKVLGKLKATIAEGNYYEAHQMYRSVCNRFRKQSTWTEARELVQAGALEFFRVGEHGSAVDLSLLLLEIYQLGKVEVTAGSCACLLDLLHQFPVSHSSRPEFIRGILNWTCAGGSCLSGEPAVHHELGQLYMREKAHEKAEKEFLLGILPDSPRAVAQMVLTESSGNYKMALLKLTDMILAYLVSMRVRCARELFEEFIRLCSDNTKPFTVKELPYEDGQRPIRIFDSPHELLNFVQFLLVACETGEARAFLLAKLRYEPQLKNSLPDASSMLGEIGQAMFGIRNQRGGGNQQMNLNNLLGSLFGGPQQQQSAPVPAVKRIAKHTSASTPGDDLD